MTDWGMKVMLDGHNVNSFEPRDYAFNSTFAMVKIFQEGSGMVTVPDNSSVTVTINHNLGFIPIAIAYTENVPSSGNFFVGAYNNIIPDTNLNSGLTSSGSRVTTTQLKLVFYNNSGSSRDMRYKYLIFADDGA